MKKTLILGLFVGLLLPFSASAAFDTSLKYGAKGSAVIELQEFLTDQGVYTGPITGNFFALTLKAVKAFQTANNITPVSGYFGALSRAKANALVDLTDTEADEVAQTGTTAPPAQDIDMAKLLVALEQLKAQAASQEQKIAEQTAKIEAQTQVQQQIATNTTPPPAPVVVVPPVPETVQVVMDSPFSWCGVDAKTTYSGVYCSNVHVGDKISFLIEGISPVIETATRVTGRYQEYSLGTEPGSLTPNTEYSYFIKVERPSEYKFAVKSGTFKTLAE